MKVENRLRFLASKNPNYTPLLAQWEFDKRLISRALNTVSNSFPHYSLHDVTHSSTIINQIEKVIAPNIELLSATDCWLLLEACYWHDCGMIVNQDEKLELVKDKDFINYLGMLKNDGGEFSLDAGSILSGIEKDNVEKLLSDSQSLMFIIADYYRSKHALRSEDHVNNPRKIGVDSPRTYLIPNRLISILGKICSCHGKNPESILELKQATDGMDLDDYAHPRYIAGLLRIGDLLDIDDGRFCDTLLKSISKIPKSSCAHKRKHESIKHLYIDSRVVEIKAVCEDYESFSTQQSWFDYIQTEFDFQKRVWNDIVPSQSYISLPTVNNISCEISGYITVNGNVPRVNLDKERIYQYLTGSLIYKYETPFLRELIQNSIDAIHYKVWAKYFHDEQLSFYIKCNDENERRKFFIEKLREELIEINLSRELNNEGGYVLSIKDSGMGMSLEDIEKIISVGSKNKGFKYSVISNMPDWAKPSGFFGIGFQSVFDISNKVIIETKQNGAQCYQIEFNRVDNQLPDVGIKKIDKKWFEGTRIDIFLNESEMKKVTRGHSRAQERIIIIHGDDEYITDPLIHHAMNEYEQFEIEQDRIYYQIKKTFMNLGMMITFNKKVIPGKTMWEAETDFDIGVDYDLKIENNREKRIGLLYRGSMVDPDYMNGLIKGNINIFLKNADDWLSINRDGIRSDKNKEVYELFRSCILRNVDKIYENSDDKKIASLFLKAHANFDSELWREIIVNGVSLGDVFDGESEVGFLLGADVDTDENYTEHEGSEPNPSDVLSVFSSVVIKEGAIPVYDMLPEGELGTSRKMTMKVTKYIDTVEQFVAPELVRRNLRHYDFASKSRRGSVVCYLKKYLYIGLSRDELPRDVIKYDFYSLLDYENVSWAKYILMPTARRGLSFKEEVEIIVGYFSRIGKEVDFGQAEELFRECWTYLEVMPKD